MRFRSFVLNKFVVAPAAAAVLAIGCAGSPTAPDGSSEASRTPGAVSPAISGGPTVQAAAQLNPTQLMERGWVCRVPPPLPDRIVCSRPNQLFPSPTTPVSERPVTFTLLVFDSAGNFVGTQIGIRQDLYAGQICESTGTTYIFRAPIGYYECVHTVGG